MNRTDREPAPAGLIFLFYALGVVLAVMAGGNACTLVRARDAAATSFRIQDVETEFAITSALAFFFLVAGECMRRSRRRRIPEAIRANDADAS